MSYGTINGKPVQSIAQLEHVAPKGSIWVAATEEGVFWVKARTVLRTDLKWKPVTAAGNTNGSA